jgi:hypothetical protein
LASQANQSTGEGERANAGGIDSLAKPWHNKELVHDVNAEGHVTPRDILILINEIDARGVRDLHASVHQEPRFFFDVSGDNRLTARDVLQVTNRLAESQDDGRSSTVSRQLADDADGMMSDDALLDLCGLDDVLSDIAQDIQQVWA